MPYREFFTFKTGPGGIKSCWAGFRDDPRSRNASLIENSRNMGIWEANSSGIENGKHFFFYFHTLSLNSSYFQLLKYYGNNHFDKKKANMLSSDFFTHDVFLVLQEQN